MNTTQLRLFQEAQQHAQEAREILASKGAPFEQTAAGKLTLALEALCQALLPEAERRMGDSFKAGFEGRR